MRLVFWQDCLSPHQLPYIVELINDIRVDAVDLIVGEIMSNDRLKIGWQFPQIINKKVPPGFNIYIQPGVPEIESLLCKRVQESIHLFVGIRGFLCVYSSFCASLKYNVRRVIITEQPLTYAYGVDWAKPLWLHKLRFMVQDRKYIPHIDYIFGIGEDCCNYYRSISSKWKVIPFMYCTMDNAINQDKQTRGSICRIVYVGSLSKRKSVITLLKAAKELFKEGYDDSYMLTIVGDGPERKSLERFIYKNGLSNVELLGMVNNKEIPNLLSQQDMLVLPSIHDGWGAVINEALQAGVYAVCSNKCGAKELLFTKDLGRVFSNVPELKEIIIDIINHIDDVRKYNGLRQKWARRHISGTVIAKYLVDVLSGIDRECPWVKAN